MCKQTNDLFKETRALLSSEPKQRPSLLSAAVQVKLPIQVGKAWSAIEILRDAPELIPEVRLFILTEHDELSVARYS